MKNSAFLSLLTTWLALSAVTQPQEHALTAWAEKYLPEVTQQARDCFSGPFSYGELGTLAETSVRAAQELKGILVGTDRAKVAQAVLIIAAREVLPDNYEGWALPLLRGEAIASLIEAAFRRLFGAEAAPPVVDAPEVPEGGVQ